MVIVYKSNTGFTKEYAEMLAKAEKMKLYTLDEAQGKVDKETGVFYMGPLMAGRIEGLETALKAFELKAVCGVGMSPAMPQVMETMCKANRLPEAPLFYLQGGWAPKKVGWLKRRMVYMVTRSTRQQLTARGSRRTPEEQANLDMLTKGGSFVAYRNLEGIRAWLKEQR